MTASEGQSNIGVQSAQPDARVAAIPAGENDEAQRILGILGETPTPTTTETPSATAAAVMQEHTLPTPVPPPEAPVMTSTLSPTEIAPRDTVNPMAVEVGDIIALQQENARLQAAAEAQERENAALRRQISQLKRPDASTATTTLREKASQFAEEAAEKRKNRNTWKRVFELGKKVYQAGDAVVGKVEVGVRAGAKTVLDKEARGQTIKYVAEAAAYYPSLAATKTAALAADVTAGGAGLVAEGLADFAGKIESGLEKKSDRSVIAAMAELFANKFRKSCSEAAVSWLGKARSIESALDKLVEGTQGKENRLNTPSADIVTTAAEMPKYQRMVAKERAKALIDKMQNGEEVDIVTAVEKTPTTIEAALMAELAQHGELLRDSMLRGDQAELRKLRTRVRREAKKDYNSTTANEARRALSVAQNAYVEKIERIRRNTGLMKVDAIQRSVKRAVKKYELMETVAS